jgi:hypothetical protein
MRQLEPVFRFLILFAMGAHLWGGGEALGKPVPIDPARDRGPQVYLSGLDETGLHARGVAGPGVEAGLNDQMRMIILLEDTQELQTAGVNKKRLIESIDNQEDTLILGELRGLVDGVVALLRPVDIVQLRQLPGVRDIVVDERLQVALDSSVPMLQAPEVWALSDSDGRPVTGRGIKVAVVDTGIDYRHPALGGCLGVGCKVIDGWDFVNNKADPMDDNGHGTHVAGIIASKDSTYRGVAPEASLLAYKACGRDGACFASHIIAAINRAVKDGAQVINLSLEGEGKPDSLLSTTVNQVVDLGITVVTAAGNRGSSGDYLIGSPGNAEKSITTGAVDRAGQVTNFSSRGGIWKGFYKPDLVAPGLGIHSTQLGGGFTSKDGSSMSAPHIAGAAALLTQLHPEWKPPEIKASLMQTATLTRKDNFDALLEGSGLAQLNMAATAGIIIEPHYLAISLSGEPVPAQSVTASLMIHNMDATSKTFSLKHSSLPGIEVKFTPATVILEGGASREVRLDFTIDQALLPEKDNFSGYICIQNINEPLNEYHIAYGLSRFLWATFDFDETPFIFSVQKTAPETNRTSYFPFSKEITIDLLRPGWYDFIVIYPSQAHFVIQSGVQLYSSRTFEINKSEANNRVKLNYRRGGSLYAMDTATVMMLSDILVYKGEPIYASSRDEIPKKGEYYFSDFNSKDYQFNLSTLVRIDKENEFYDLSYSIPGLDRSMDLVSDLESSYPMVVPFNARINEESYLSMYSMTLDAPHRFTVQQSMPQISADSTITLHLQPATGTMPAYRLRRFSLCSTLSCYDQEFKSTRFFETPFIHADQNGIEILSIKSEGNHYPGGFVQLMEVRSEPYPLNAYPSFWNGSFSNQPYRINLSYSVSGYDWETPYLRDWGGNMLVAPIDYRIFFDNSLWVAGSLSEELTTGINKVSGWSASIPRNGAVRIGLSYPDSYNGAQTMNRVMAEFDTSRSDPNPPSVQALVACQSEENGYEREGEIYFYAEDESWIQKVIVEVQPKEGSAWKELDVLRTNLNVYKVNLDRAKLTDEARIRIVLEDSHGNRIQQDTSLPKDQVVGCSEQLLGQTLHGKWLHLPLTYATNNPR